MVRGVMPVNYLQIQNQVRELGAKARQVETDRRDRLEQSRQALEQHAAELPALRERVDRALSANSNLRCAVPLDERLDAAFPAPEFTPPCVLLAADGSQINPSRHERVEFGVINLGAIRLCPGQAEIPRETVESDLLVYDALHTSRGPVTEEIMALRRDLRERQMLLRLTENEAPPVITLTDGPLELFREPSDNDQAEFRRAFEDYRLVLRELAARGVSTAGYVDKPRSDLLVRLLELTLLPDELLAEAGRGQRPLEGISDALLLQHYLRPGERSALFAIQSPSAQKFDGELRLHFFYMNAGREGHPSLARVELPEWVASDRAALGRLHAVLLRQCRQMGTRPYPYALHRAHEIAVVRLDERAKVEDMIVAELTRLGIAVGDKSNKQVAKDNNGRTRLE